MKFNNTTVLFVSLFLFLFSAKSYSQETNTFLNVKCDANAILYIADSYQDQSGASRGFGWYLQSGKTGLVSVKLVEGNLVKKHFDVRLTGGQTSELDLRENTMQNTTQNTTQNTNDEAVPNFNLFCKTEEKKTTSSLLEELRKAQKDNNKSKQIKQNNTQTITEVAPQEYWYQPSKFNGRREYIYQDVPNYQMPNYSTPMMGGNCGPTG